MLLYCMNAKLPDWNNWLTEEAAGCHTDSTTAPNESRQPPWKKKPQRGHNDVLSMKSGV